MNEPQQTKLSLWKRLRQNYWGSLVFDVSLILLVVVAVNIYQNHDLPGTPEHAPELKLSTLDGTLFDIDSLQGKTTVVYFFAPWCHICHASIGNLEALWQDNKETVNAIVVAQDYQSIQEIQDFVDDLNLNMPVLLGTQKTQKDWSIFAFPTYYVITPEGKIKWRSVGYSTELGLRIRT